MHDYRTRTNSSDDLGFLSCRTYPTSETKQEDSTTKNSGNSSTPLPKTTSFTATWSNWFPQLGQATRMSCDGDSFFFPMRQTRRKRFPHFGQVATQNSAIAIVCSFSLEYFAY